MNFFPFFSSTGQRSCQEIMWEDSELTRFVSFHSFSPSPSSCSLSVSHTHTNTYARSLPHKQGKPTSLRSANRMHEKAMKEDIRINILICMYYTLFTSRSFPIIPTQLWLFALSISVSASQFLHHSVYFCLTHPLSNSVTSPYVSRLSLHLPLLFCQMPMIHIRSVYTSCCSSFSSHLHTCTSFSWFFLLFQSLMSSSSPTVFLPPPVPLR